MVHRGVYTLRGWLAFVAFLDFAQCLRSFYDKDSFLGSFMLPPTQPGAVPNNSTLPKYPVPPTTARLLLLFSLQNGVILVICAFCIHYWPMILTTILSLLAKIFYLLSESVKFRSAPFNFHIIFPLVVHGITFIALLFSHVLLAREASDGEENDEIVRQRCTDGKPLYLHKKKRSAAANNNKKNKNV